MDSPGRALLQLAAEIDPSIREAFDRWCEGHVRIDLALPGFLRVRRFARTEGWAGEGESMRFLTVYDLEDLGALSSSEYDAHDDSLPGPIKAGLRFERRVFEEVESYGAGLEPDGGGAIFHVLTEVEPGYEEAFDRWYGGEHVPAVVTAPGVRSARRFRQVRDPAAKGSAPARHTCLAIYEMDDVEVLTRPESVRAAEKAVCPPDLDPFRNTAHHVYEPFLSLKRE